MVAEADEVPLERVAPAQGSGRAAGFHHRLAMLDAQAAPALRPQSPLGGNNPFFIGSALAEFHFSRSGQAAGAVVLLLGAVDDVWGLRSRYKMLGMFVVSVAMYTAGFRIGAVSNPFGPALNFGWLTPAITVFWFLGCMNAINLIDGLDGLAAGVTVFASGTVLLVGLAFGNSPAALLAAALAGAKAEVREQKSAFEASETLGKKGYQSQRQADQTFSSLQSAKAELELARIELKRIEIKAPFDGVVLRFRLSWVPMSM